MADPRPRPVRPAAPVGVVDEVTTATLPVREDRTTDDRGPRIHWDHPDKPGYTWCGAESLGIYAPDEWPVTCADCLNLKSDWRANL